MVAAETGQLFAAQIEVCNLSERMHPGIRASSNRELRRFAEAAKDCGEGILEHTLHCAQLWLPSPTVKVSAVIRDVESYARHGTAITAPTVLYALCHTPSLLSTPHALHCN